MIRKLILSAVFTTSTLTAMVATPTTAEASLPPLLPHHRFEVLVLRGSQGWQSHGVYRLHVEAKVIAIRLRQQGYKVEIREF
ncbi:hypothetical protein R5W24_005267 [Gemmata sp. JC717]|uniref:Uncharacterized protein n=1 Tax=Gemmata algarum TaxID=2975278 RepID=A0ABU5F1F1_9BACT|nr:hypothetical protein [Gemmata algarum]MDY3556104.1 hypothetical protein [Gemmata algarum]MDY3560652.1 hypothetical protein [Gemmata algarum]